MKNKVFGFALAIMSALSFTCNAFADAETRTVTCAFKTVPYGESVLLFSDAKLQDFAGISATSFVRLGSNAWTSYSINTIYDEDPALDQKSFEGNGFYHLANDGITLTCQVQSKASGYDGNLLGCLFLELTQNGSDIYGKVTEFKYLYGSNYGVDGTTKKSSNSTSYWTDENMSASGSVFYFSLQDLELTLYSATEDFTVTFVDKDGGVVSTQTVSPGADAVAPSESEITTFDGYVFYAWDTTFSAVRSDLTVTALYHKLLNVKFVDSDGEVLDSQIVEETKSATPPDMSGKTYQGQPFIGWSARLDNITEDVVLTALYGELPDYIQSIVASGLIPEDGLLWIGGTSGSWDGTNWNWTDSKGSPSTWLDGSVAVFPINASISLDEARTVASIVLVYQAEDVILSGAELDFVSPGTARFVVSSTLRFENAIGGPAGYNQTADDGVTAVTQFGGSYLSSGALTVTDGKCYTVGTATIGVAGKMTAPLYIHDDAEFHFGSSANVEFANLINCTSVQYATLYNKSNGRLVVDRTGNVTFNNASENSMRCGAPVYVYGLAEIKDGNYHGFYSTPGVTVEDGGVLNIKTGNSSYGHRDFRLTCNAGGTVNYNSNRSMGTYDTLALFDGGVGNFTSDYSASLGDDIKHKDVRLKDGASLTGVMMTWAHSDPNGKISVLGTASSTIALQKIRLGQNMTANSSSKMLQTLDVDDVTGDAAVDLTVTSELYKHTSAVCAPENAPYFSVIKTGTGTVKFTGVSTDMGASFTLVSGTLAFGSSAKINSLALCLNGNGALAVEPGAEVVFGDTSPVAWTDGAKLNITGTLGKRQVRFGTDKNGLTAAQLSAILYNGRYGKVWLDDEGYLSSNNPFVIIVR